MEEQPKKKRTYKRTKYPDACPNIRETKQRKANAKRIAEEKKAKRAAEIHEMKVAAGKKLGLKFGNLSKNRKFETPQDLANALEEYFTNTPIEQWTLTGIALSLGTNRNTLGRYEEKEEYRAIVEKARTLVEHSYELGLKANGKAGDIFALKNFGWRDDRSFTMSGEGGGAIKHEWKIEVVDPTTKETVLIAQEEEDNGN